MPRLIKKGKPKEFKIKCRGCGSTVGYIKNEIKKEDYTDPWGFYEYSEYIHCPNCRKRITIKSLP